MGRLVVIGGQAAGMSAAARARRVDPSLEIWVLEQNPWVSFAPCGLPYWLEGAVASLRDLEIHTAESFARQRNIRVRTGCRVVAIHHAARQVALETGERVAYDALVIATGARVRRDLPGASQPHVFALQTPQDAQRLKNFLEERKPRRAVVIGGGYLGLEAVEVLRYWGLEVVLFEARPGLLGWVEPGLARVLVEHLQSQAVEVRLGQEVKSIGEREVAGEACELVLLATGFRPNVELAEQAGVQLGRTGAIWVDEHMRTSIPGIYAAGDCIETVHLVSGAPVYIPLGTTANKTGRVAGACAAGARERFEGVTGTAVVRVGDLAVGVTGLSSEQARRVGFDAVSVEIEARDRPRYYAESRPIRVFLVGDRKSGRLLGGAVAGQFGVAGRVNVIATALRGRLTVEEFYGTDLAYAPPFAPVWDPLLVAARELSKKL